MMKIFKSTAISALLVLAFNLSLADFQLIMAESKSDNPSFYKAVKSNTGNRVAWFVQADDYERVFGIGRVPSFIVTYDFDGQLATLPGSNTGGWPLTEWLFTSKFQERLDRLKDNDLNDVTYSLNVKNPLGCMASTPLRYGDLEGDNDNELVLILGNSLVIFSPQYERTIFAVRLKLVDWLNTADTEFLYSDESGNINKPVTEPQYASGIENTIRTLQVNIPGYRGYAKLFEGDFDNDGSFDLLVWQKVYESKLENDSQRGFDIVGNHFFHYERDLKAQANSEAGITGEYLPQDTSEEDIQNWLTENNLTWSKGYPSRSECPGEEGQLIPEMHDALLNDPDVLQ